MIKNDDDKDALGRQTNDKVVSTVLMVIGFILLGTVASCMIQ